MSSYDEQDSLGIILPDAGRMPQVKLASNAKTFDPSLIHTNIDISHLVQRLAFVGESEGLNFCFYGLPGTGKTEFGRYVAQQLGKMVILVSTGDFMFSKLGASERMLQIIFERAKQQKAVLIFDEAESCFRNRIKAQHNWEIQLVNEFIRLLDQHNQPVICTTNMLEELDDAVLRRMMFKIEFLPLQKDQLSKTFRKYFGIAAPDYLMTLPNLTLADFNLVYRKAAVLGYLYEPETLNRLFYDECMARHTVQVARKKKSAKS